MAINEIESTQDMGNNEILIHRHTLTSRCSTLTYQSEEGTVNPASVSSSGRSTDPMDLAGAAGGSDSGLLLRTLRRRVP